MYLFLDTNQYLGFYHFSIHDLKELSKLTQLLKKGELHLLLPEQVEAEFWRLREGVIAGLLGKLKDYNFSHFPQICKEFQEYKDLQKKIREYNKLHADLVRKITLDVSQNSLKADGVVEDLFQHAERIPLSAKIRRRAKARRESGNPPCRSADLGDALNWETLLQAVPEGDRLDLVSADEVYYSPLLTDQVQQFLALEWQGLKQSPLVAHRKLADYFKLRQPQIKLASEIKKEILIEELSRTSLFSDTHMVVAKMAGLSFSADQANEIARIALENSQVHWIIKDQDVAAFLGDLAKAHQADMEPGLHKELCKELGLET